METTVAIEVFGNYTAMCDRRIRPPKSLDLVYMHAVAHLLRRDYIEPFVCENGHAEFVMTDKFFAETGIKPADEDE